MPDEIIHLRYVNGKISYDEWQFIITVSDETDTEVLDWCYDNISSAYSVETISTIWDGLIDITVVLTSEPDAVAFKLRWS